MLDIEKLRKDVDRLFDLFKLHKVRLSHYLDKYYLYESCIDNKINIENVFNETLEDFKYFDRDVLSKQQLRKRFYSRIGKHWLSVHCS